MVHDGIIFLTLSICEGDSPNCDGLCSCPISIGNTFFVDAAASVLLASDRFGRRYWKLDPVYFRDGGEAVSLLLLFLVASLKHGLG